MRLELDVYPSGEKWVVTVSKWDNTDLEYSNQISLFRDLGEVINHLGVEYEDWLNSLAETEEEEDPACSLFDPLSCQPDQDPS